MLKEHSAKCQFNLFPCPNRCGVKGKDGEKKQFSRKGLAMHLKSCPYREYECERCGKKDKYAIITKYHEKHCPMKIVPCSNAECTHTVARGGVKRHLDECVYTEVSCKYVKLGCGVKMQRRGMPAHEEDDSAHFHMSLDTVARLQSQLDKLEEGKPMTFKITDYTSRIENNGYFESPSFYSHPGGYHMYVDVYLNTGDYYDEEDRYDLGLYISLLRGDFDDQLTWPFVGKARIRLLNQGEDRYHFEKIIDFEFERQGYGVNFSIGEFGLIPSSNVLEFTDYLQNDTLYFDVSIDVAGHKPWLKCTNKASYQE